MARTRLAANASYPSTVLTNSARFSGAISNMDFPRGWSTNPALRAQVLTNPAYRAWYSNYVQRMRGMTNADGSTNRSGPGLERTTPFQIPIRAE